MMWIMTDGRLSFQFLKGNLDKYHLSIVFALPEAERMSIISPIKLYKKFNRKLKEKIKI